MSDKNNENQKNIEKQMLKQTVTNFKREVSASDSKIIDNSKAKIKPTIQETLVNSINQEVFKGPGDIDAPIKPIEPGDLINLGDIDVSKKPGDLGLLPNPIEPGDLAKPGDFDVPINLGVVKPHPNPIFFDQIKQEISNSLIPVKGISKKLIDKLSKCKIFDAVSLLSRCKTHEQRKNVAEKVGVHEDNVDSWVKQVLLWRVDYMTTDMAFLLAQAGIRSIQDLSRVSVEKAYPILVSLQRSQPDFVLVSKDELKNIIDSAKDISGNVQFDTDKVIEPIKSLLEKNTNNLNAAELKQLIEEIRSKSLGREKNLVIRKPNVQIINDNPFGFIESSTGNEEQAPTYLFEEVNTVEESSSEEMRLSEEWNYLNELFEKVYDLPLPRYVKGFVKFKETDSSDSKPFAGVKVEIDGIVSPAEDKTEAVENPSCVTNSEGAFIIPLPERYCFKETIKVIVTDTDGGRQEFVKIPSEVINSTKEYKLVELVKAFVLDDKFYKDKLKELQVFYGISDEEEDNVKENDFFIETVKNMLDYIEQHPNEEKNLESNNNVDRSSSVFKKKIDDVFDYILNNATLEAHIEGTNLTAGDDGFVVLKSVFYKYSKKIEKALPRVKLMGDGDDEVSLSTDTAPSRMFSYSMLQRLIEPEISTGGRVKLSGPVDVDGFKNDLYKNSTKIPQSTSLGLGYMLNMHQAWVPDGFALGDLLYSVILAPGEEQRLIVRENRQSYEIIDTAEGSDLVNENYSNTQTDDTTAAFDYAARQMMEAGSSYSAKSSSWGIGGSASGGGFFGGGGFLGLGIGGGYSKSSSSGSSNAHQNNSHNEASSAAQKFQHCIKTASNKLSQAKRVCVSTATSEQTDSVATKIIANHNHSHAMTIQYWEVMRRYRIETAIDSVNLALFVPLKFIQFLPERQELVCSENTISSFNKDNFEKRYSVLLKHATALKNALPYTYRSGLTLIQKYASTPKWKFETTETSAKNLTLTFKGNFFTFDDLTASITLKNGYGSVAGEVSYTRNELPTNSIITRNQLREYIRTERNKNKGITVICSFCLPQNIAEEDIGSIKIGYSCEPLQFHLCQDEDFLSASEKKALEKYHDMEWDFAKDDNKSSRDIQRMNHYMEALPEAYRDPIVNLSSSQIRQLGLPIISEVNLMINGNPLQTTLSSSQLSGNTRISVYCSTKTLKRTEFQKMEETFQHVVTNTLQYSQVVWGSLTSDERAMMLEPYTVQMNFENISSGESQGNGKNIPLLNCVNVHKVLGFYGNCILLPFTFPSGLADQLGRTAADVQDEIYRYHTNAFRAPTTVISLPTKGMIGEAVLGKTNVSEVIDLTRFWNWQDSPIDKMNVDKDYLNGTDYLNGKQTKDITALNLQGVTPTNAVTVPDLVNALVQKEMPKFDNITGLDQLKDVVNQLTTASSTGRDNIINKTSDMVTSTLDTASKVKQAEISADKEIVLAALKGGKPDSSNQSNNVKSDLASAIAEFINKIKSLVSKSDGEKPSNAAPSNPSNGEKPSNAAPSNPSNGEKPSNAAPSNPSNGEKPSNTAPSNPSNSDKPSNTAPSNPSNGEKPSNAAPSNPSNSDKPSNTAPSNPSGNGDSDEGCSCICVC